MSDFKKALVWITFACLIFSFTGCGGGGNDPGGGNGNTGNTDATTTITLELGGFPFDNNSYDLVVHSVVVTPDNKDKDYEILATYLFDNVSGSFQREIVIDNKATDIDLYLLGRESEEPIFCWGFPFDPDQRTYHTNYWLYYNLFFYDKIIRFGISESMAKILTIGVNEGIDFNNGYYFLYKLLNVNQRKIKVETAVSQGSVSVKTGASLAELVADPSRAARGVQTKIINSTNDSLYILLESGSYDEKDPIARANICININAGCHSVAGQQIWRRNSPVPVLELRIPKIPTRVLPYPNK